MSWRLRYATHLGYRPPFRPLFTALAGTEDRLEHVRFAAGQGFAGVQYASALARPVVEQERVGRALADAKLEPGCLLYTTFDRLHSTNWVTATREARALVDAELTSAIEVARRIGATRLVVVPAADPVTPRPAQLGAFVDNLRFGADLAGRAGMTICIETLDRQRVPGMLLHHVPEAHAIIRGAAHPCIRLVFDTAHVHSMDGDVVRRLEEVWDAIDVIQIADSPGRFQPGTGEIDILGVLRVLVRRGWTGLVELEHDWDGADAATERAGLDALLQLDAIASRSASGEDS